MLTTTFKDFLIEKVSQREVDNILKDKDIKIGMEFEFILDDYDNVSSLFDNAAKDYEKYMTEVKKFFDKVNKELPKRYYNDVIMPAAKKVIKDFESRITELENKKKELEKTVDNWATTNQDELQEMIVDVDTELDDIKEDYENFKYELSISKDTTDFTEIADLIEQWVEYELPTVYEYFNENYELPLSPSSLDEFYNVIGNGNWREYSIDDVLFQFIKFQFEYDYDADIEFNKDYFEQELYSNSYYYPIMDNFEDHMDDISSMRFIDLPFPFDVSQADIGEYHNSSNYHKWRIESDDSLSAGGIEVISPILTLPDGIKTLKEMFAFIRDYGHTDSSTGFHVNLSIDGIHSMDDVNLLKLMLFMEENSVWKFFKDRKNNEYTESIKRIVADAINAGKNDIPLNDLRRINNYFKFNLTKFFGVNLEHFPQRIEFRYLGGKDYHRKEKEVIHEIAKFAFNLKLAADPSFKRKEYIRKLYSMLNKIELADGNTPVNKEERNLLLAVQANGVKIEPNKLPKVKITYRDFVYTIDTKKNKILSVDTPEPTSSVIAKKILAQSDTEYDKRKGVYKARWYRDLDNITKKVYIMFSKGKKFLAVKTDPLTQKEVQIILKHGTPTHNDNCISYHKYKGDIYKINTCSGKIISKQRVK